MKDDCIEDIVNKELENFSLVGLTYELYLDEYPDEVDKPFQSLLFFLKRDEIKYVHRLYKRIIKFSELDDEVDNEVVSYYYEKGEIEVRSVICKYIPYLSDLNVTEIIRTKDTVRLVILNSNYLVEYVYVKRDNLW